MMLITVPDTAYCYSERGVCGHFDFENGQPTCDLGFCGLEADNKTQYVLKADKCENLKKQKG